MQIKFDALISQDLTLCWNHSNSQKQRNDGISVPYAMTNCHNSLCAVGGTINEDDHVFGLTAAKSMVEIMFHGQPGCQHAYAREELSKVRRHDTWI